MDDTSRVVFQNMSCRTPVFLWNTTLNFTSEVIPGLRIKKRKKRMNQFKDIYVYCYISLVFVKVSLGLYITNMDSLAGYSSGSDAEAPSSCNSNCNSNKYSHSNSDVSSIHNNNSYISNVTKPAPAVVSPAPAAGGVRGSKAQPKKKKLDISFLPKHIQDALLRGEGVDSEEEDARGPSAAAPRQPRAPPSQDQRSGLLGLLPKPKSEATVFEMPAAPPAARPTPLSNYDSGSEGDEESDAEIGADLAPSVSPAPETGESSMPDFSQRLLSQSGSMGYRTGFSVGLGALKPAAGLSMGIGEGQAEESSCAYPQAEAWGGEKDESMDTEVSRANKRKRERDLEIQMLKGDMSGSSRLDAALHNIDYSSFQWNASEHNMQVEREHEIKSVYKVGSNDGSNAPTKMQSSKHQINSLVLRAQETELRNLNKQTKSRSQAAAKYGW